LISDVKVKVVVAGKLFKKRKVRDKGGY